MGAFSGAIGRLLVRWQSLLQIIGGFIVILFGLHYLGLPIRVLPRKWLSRLQADGFLPSGFKPVQKRTQITSLLSAALFGMVFSMTWTPCVGVFLGSALVLAAQKGSTIYGMAMLLCYSAGLGAPFIFGAYLIHQGKQSFAMIKGRLPLVTRMSGAFLIVMGLLIASGYLGAIASKLS